MSKYSKMVEKNKQESKERVARAIRVIQEMSENGEQLVVCDLVKKTGYSRTFFYKNQEVRDFFEEARKQQDGMVFYHKKKMVLDHAILRQNEILKIQIAKIKKENEKLEKRLSEYKSQEKVNQLEIDVSKIVLEIIEKYFEAFETLDIVEKKNQLLLLCFFRRFLIYL